VVQGWLQGRASGEQAVDTIQSKLLAALKAKQAEHAEAALGVGSGDAFSYGMAVGKHQGLLMAAQVIDDVLSERGKKREHRNSDIEPGFED
jgi:hypothetical protein